MSTLVDELLQDFEDSGSEAGDNREDGDLTGGEGEDAGNADADADADANRPERSGTMDLDPDMGGGHGDEDDEMGGMNGDAVDLQVDAEDAKAKVEKMQLAGVRDVRSIAGLTKQLEPVLEKIEYFQSQPLQTQTAIVGNVEDHPEYHVLTESNGLSTSIDSEIVLVHKFIRDHYSVRFPELETLVTNPLEYAKVVALLGNGPMDAESIKALQTSTDNILHTSLKSTVDGPTLMIVTVEATTSKGRQMTEEELNRVLNACEMVIYLDRAKKTLTEYVQSRMTIFAPNLTNLVGSLTAAQLLNAAGGLTGLTKTPSCNIPAWGSKKQANPGLATNVGIRQQGFLFQSEIIRSAPSDLKRQAMRIVSGKLILAARIDRAHSSPDGSTGEELKAQCLERLDKLQEKPLNKGGRALPVPDDKPSRKRGGRRARKAKEATAMTDLRKAQNRMAFGKEEKEVGYGTGDSTAGMGMIGMQGDGRVRNLQIDQRTRAKLSQKHKGWGGATSINPTGGQASSLNRAFGAGAAGTSTAAGLRTSGVGTTVGGGGTMSSLRFASGQGLELVDPKVQAELNRKRKAEEDRWFNGGTFTQVGGGGGGGGSGASNGGLFKKPDLPPAKRVNTGK